MLILTLLSLIHAAIALPTALSTDASDFTPQVGSSAATRSTSEIVWSCITTLLVCTWVAVHPNVPSIHASNRELFWRRVKILIVALIVPEFIIIWAAIQLRSASYTVKTLRRHWTMTHGLFLVMGGFMLTDASGKHMEALQAEDLARLLRKGDIAFRHIPESEIMDKSKGDALAKTLILIQTTWFIAQVISRAVLHLPITELELTTVAFALLNFLTYALWWKKPLDVRRPIILSLPPRVSKSILDVSDTIRTLHYAEGREVSTQIPLHPGVEEVEVSRISGPVQRSVSPMTLSIDQDDKNQTPRKPLLSISFIDSVWVYFHRFVGGFILPDFVLQENQKDTDNVPLFYSGPRRPLPFRLSTKPLFYRYFFLFRSTISEMLIGTLFGLIHCAAWTFHFPSKLERDLWRIMSLFITAVPLTIIIAVIPILMPRYAYLARINRLFFVIYIFARLTIFIMAFVLLRDLPEGAFQEIQWTTYIPHV
ncbi:hypothetical protein GYMLUDRAFT_985423 [Collybiopsis luxurians FD-317 M1]|uniref:Uncharacterized protein n=1 Tax=Collybiopsis luxurians FD-317 M1 TaxID=944289 RepID=A0A0D0CWL6_9AGAR|nr:hypothetical protein GYMLUDRAFT_985423 [Collybiopsis luxurians FD-317 M1]